MINFSNNLALFGVKNANFWRKYFENHNIGDRSSSFGRPIANNLALFMKTKPRKKSEVQEFKASYTGKIFEGGPDPIGLRPILNFALGANFDPRGEVVPQGLILSPGSEVIPWG
jgi:hypothetical protein